MKALGIFFQVLLISGFLVACDRDLKEHKVPPATLKKLEKKYDPAVKAMEISGSVTLPLDYANPIPQGAVLFIFARPEGVDSGPPLAVKRIGYFEFPYAYAIGPADTMIPGAKFEGRLNLSVRMDRDGDTKARPGDLLGSVVAEPGQKVDILLDQEIPSSGKKITGTLSLDPALKSKVPANAVLYLFVRAQGVAGGPPLVVKRLALPQLPYNFTLSEADAMMPNVDFNGPMTVTARLDGDGSALGSPGDIEGTVDTNAGESGVKLTLDHVVGG